MGSVFRLCVLAIAVYIHARFVLFVGATHDPAPIHHVWACFRRDFANVPSTCCVITEHAARLFGPVALEAGKKPSREIGCL
jgi:hypothetical protein